MIAATSSQVNQEIYSEEDLLAIDSSPEEVIDQLAVESYSDGQGTVVLPPPSFNPIAIGKLGCLSSLYFFRHIIHRLRQPVKI